MKSQYEPLSATEQDVLQRMVENQDLYVEVVNWGFHPDPTITTGDKRIQIRFPMEFTEPQGLQVPVTEFKLRLKLRNGETVAETVESTVHNNQPLMVTAGLQIDLIWDLSLDMVSEDVKGEVLPDITGEKVAEIEDGEVVKTDDSSSSEDNQDSTENQSHDEDIDGDEEE